MLNTVITMVITRIGGAVEFHVSRNLNANQKIRTLVEALSDLVAAVRNIDRRTVEMQYASPQLILSSENSRGV